MVAAINKSQSSEITQLKASIDLSLNSLETEMLDNISRLLKPIAEQIAEMKTTLQQVTQIVKSAMELRLLGQDDIKHLYQTETSNNE